MSKKERQRLVSAKQKSGKAGKYKRSSSTNVKGARKKGATLRDWFKKEKWVNIATGKPCGQQVIYIMGYKSAAQRKAVWASRNEKKKGKKKKRKTKKKK